MANFALQIFAVRIFLKLDLIVVFAFFALIACTEEKEESMERSGAQAGTTEFIQEQLDLIQKKIEGNPNSARSYNQRAKLYLELKDFDNALKDGNYALSLDSTNEEFFFTIAQALKGQNRIAEAFEAAKKAEKMMLKTAEFYTFLGKLYFIIQDYGSAFHYLNLAEDRSPFNTGTFFYKGLMYLELGDTIKAIKYLELSIEQVPEDTDVFNVMASVYNAMGQPDMALEYLKTGISYNPRDPFLHYNFGVTYLDMGDIDTARYFFAMSTSVDSTFYLGHYNLGIVNYEFGNYNLAVENLSRAAELKPGIGNSYFFLGLALEQTGRLQDALDALEKGVEQYPNRDEIAEARDRVKNQIEFGNPL